MSRLDEEVGDSPRDSYESIKRLAMVQIQPPRNPSKPFTSFGIKDILGSIHSVDHPDEPLKKRELGEIDNLASKDKNQCKQDRQQDQCQILSRCLGNQMRSLKRSSCLSPSPSPSDDFEKDTFDSHHNIKTNAAKRQARKSTTKDMNSNRDSSSALECNFLQNSKFHEAFKPELFRGGDGEHQIPMPDLSISPAQLGLCSPPLDGRRFHQGNNRSRSVLSEELPSPAWNHDDSLKPVNLSTTKIVRPWDNDTCSLSPPPKRQQQQHPRKLFTPPSSGVILTASEASSDEEEEISVDDDEPPTRGSLIAKLTHTQGHVITAGGNSVKNSTNTNKNSNSSSSSNKKKLQSVSPLDALMAMTSKTFEGLETCGSSGKFI
ncbi:transcription factor lbx1 [Plakobranchus ocellatus]|uniref:Transcription factor lbx1 n=1 Tax=Plakobranchus ocellatus TaxID=259542 RepID=A0AAV4CYD7_9GAST|nr:transcription factor lbx1 [Plakobranchus ocellatus]